MEKSLIGFLSQNKFKKFTGSILKKITPYWYSSVFPHELTDSLRWESLSTGIYTPAAPVITFGSSAPEVKRNEIVQLRGEISPIAIKRKMSEKVKIELENELNKTLIVREVYNDINYVWSAVKNRLEFMVMQSLSTGKITLDANTNALGQKLVLDWNVPANLKEVVGTVWSNAASATPIADIDNFVKTLNEDYRIYPEKILMSKTVFNRMKSTTEVLTKLGIKVTVKNVQHQLIGLEAINTVLTANDLPAIEIVRDDVIYQNVGGDFDLTKERGPRIISHLSLQEITVEHCSHLSQRKTSKARRIISTRLKISEL